MSWTINYSEQALKSLKKMSRQDAHRIINFLESRLTPHENPRSLGKALKGELGTFWRYRVGNYRILCQIEDSQLIILAAAIGHRKNIYK